MSTRFVLQRLRRWTAKVNEEPILILGNQKSGTTAIACLLAELTRASVTSDLPDEARNPTYDKVVRGELAFERFVQRYRLEFSRRIIKEPSLSLLYPHLARRFPAARFVFVLRDPHENIRSILNRLRMPGDQVGLEAPGVPQLSRAWRLNLDCRWLGLPGGSYIEMLAYRWRHLANVYLNDASHFALIRYEDFLRDKLSALRRLAHDIGLEESADIRSRLDVPFQPRGDRSVSIAEFFGAENHEQISRICAREMTRLGYASAGVTASEMRSNADPCAAQELLESDSQSAVRHE